MPINTLNSEKYRCPIDKGNYKVSLNTYCNRFKLTQFHINGDPNYIPEE